MTSHSAPDPLPRSRGADPVNPGDHVFDVAALTGLRARLGHWRVRLGDGAPVPITVWRIDRPAQALRSGREGLPSVVARRLVAFYTRPVESVADADADPTLADAARAASRRYQRVDLDHDDPAAYAGTANLVVMHWPRPGATSGDAASARLAAARTMVAATGALVVALAPDDVAAGHAHGLVHAAHHAKLIPWRLLAVASRHPRAGTHRRAAVWPTLARHPRVPSARISWRRSRVQLDLVLLVVRAADRV